MIIAWLRSCFLPPCCLGGSHSVDFFSSGFWFCSVMLLLSFFSVWCMGHGLPIDMAQTTETYVTVVRLDAFSQMHLFIHTCFRHDLTVTCSKASLCCALTPFLGVLVLRTITKPPSSPKRRTGLFHSSLRARPRSRIAVDKGIRNLFPFHVPS